MSLLLSHALRVGQGLAVIAALGMMTFTVILPRLTGGAALTVLSGSMTPAYPVGSIVFVQPVDPLTIEDGDVITFQTAPGVAEYVTHRVVRVQPDTEPYSFITKGDANNIEDIDPVPIGAVRGVVRFHIPYMGRIGQLVRSPLGLFIALTALPAMWVIRRQVVVIRRELRNGDHEDATPRETDEPGEGVPATQATRDPRCSCETSVGAWSVDLAQARCSQHPVPASRRTAGLLRAIVR